MAAEADLAATIRELMERCGFLRDTYSQDRRTRAQLAGHPDDVFIGHGRLLYVEYKIPPNGLTTAEEAWWDEHRPCFYPPYIDGRIWTRLDDAVEWIEANTWGRPVAEMME